MRLGRSQLLRGAWCTAAISLALLALPSRASAHGLIIREDLPLPDWLFVWGAAIVLIVSFVGLSMAWTTVRLEEYEWKPAPEWLSNVALSPVLRGLAGLIGVALLAITVWAGLYGTDAPDRNFAVTFVFVTFWLGFVVLSIIFGDVFRAFNPWYAIGRLFGKGFTAIAGQSMPPPLAYPERLGRWPAVVGLAAFTFLELGYGFSGFQAVGLTGYTVATATLVYSAITFIGMCLFGVEKWIERGESFSVYFGMFASMSPVEVREGRLGFRPPLRGLVHWAILPGSLSLVIVAIGSTAYDGASEGILLDPSGWLFEQMIDGGLGNLFAIRLSNTVFLLLSIFAVWALFRLGLAGTPAINRSRAETRRAFAHAFVPIALAYLVAHYFTLVFFQMQAQVTYLASDPLGDGKLDLFGGADYLVDPRGIGAELVWYVQVGALVVGHVIALALAHDRALKLYGDARAAARSQRWMLVAMVAFTSIGLFLLSQVNG